MRRELIPAVWLWLRVHARACAAAGVVRDTYFTCAGLGGKCHIGKFEIPPFPPRQIED